MLLDHCIGKDLEPSLHLKYEYSFAPRCKPGTEQTSVGSLNMHSLHVKCEVEADPPDGVRFSWTYNNTRNVSPVLNSRISSHGLVSTMTYLPQSDSELVTLACWAINNVGRQTVPCLIHILPATVGKHLPCCVNRTQLRPYVTGVVIAKMLTAPSLKSIHK
uniref:Ig-like domain-containing protein n=1 Tax=Anopheles melas TaxID=34690 RepID=A0A182THQ7_9DIPT